MATFSVIMQQLTGVENGALLVAVSGFYSAPPIWTLHDHLPARAKPILRLLLFWLPSSR
jgi:hypothetical protein